MRRQSCAPKVNNGTLDRIHGSAALSLPDLADGEVMAGEWNVESLDRDLEKSEWEPWWNLGNVAGETFFT